MSNSCSHPTCGWCHSDGGRVAGKGPQLMNSPRSDDFLRNRIKTGKEGAMPAFGSAFSDAQIDADHQIHPSIEAGRRMSRQDLIHLSLEHGNESNSPAHGRRHHRPDGSGSGAVSRHDPLDRHARAVRPPQLASIRQQGGRPSGVPGRDGPSPGARARRLAEARLDHHRSTRFAAPTATSSWTSLRIARLKAKPT